MPGFDRTGPRGLGQRTGRGMGPCGDGYGYGGGYGGGFGRGFGWRRFFTKKEEAEDLKDEAEDLEAELKAIKERLAEIKDQK